MKLKKFSIFIVLILSLILINGCKKNDKAADKNQAELKEKSSYIIGYDMGRNLKSDNLDVDTNILFKGLKDSLKGDKSKYTAEESKKIMMELQTIMAAKKKEAAEKNKKDGEQFLEKNKSNPGVVVLADGLQYKIITEGKGLTPKLKDSVKINLIGKLIDGNVYDDTYKSNKPITLVISKVIPGVKEALLLMKTGSKWELYIPSELAYKEQSFPAIPSNSTLIMEVELLSIEEAKK